MKELFTGLCAAKGFKANGVHCGIRKNKTKRDLALVTCDVMCTAASVYTTNKVKGAPIFVTKNNIANGMAKAIICNSGNANTCNSDGVEKALKMCALVEEYTGINKEDVIVASTGVIGQPIDMEPIEKGMTELVLGLGDHSDFAAQAIMTTDTVKKEFAYEFEVDGKVCHIGAIAKGSGMIHPNMATLLCFVTTDVAISSKMLQKALSSVIKDTLNMVSIDGDTSTNDMASVMASGLAGNKEIVEENKDYEDFKLALMTIFTRLAKAIAKDGEGATRMMECVVYNAESVDVAKKIAKSVACSSLLKAALFASDANWGRILCAIGYTDADFDIMKIDVDLVSKAGSVQVCNKGFGVAFDEDFATKVLKEDEVQIMINCNSGNAKATAWGCDLTYEYVKINAEYRT